MRTPETCWIHTPQGRLHAVRHAGAHVGASPIVLFHDSLGAVELWRDFPAVLAEATGHAVIAYDRLGFGQSDPHPGRLSNDLVRSEAREGFRALRDQLGFDDFIAFGHSVGGGMAVGCAAAYPDACRALITESAQAFVEDRTIAGIVAARASFAKAGQLDRLRRYHGDKAEWVLRSWIDTWLADDFAQWNLDDDLRCVVCPTLAMHGLQDEFGSTRHPERIAALVAGPVSMQILECGHVPHRELPGVVLALTAQHLAAIPPR